MLEVHELGVTVAGRELIRDLSFCLEPGRVTVVLGPNGSGKTSLLRTLSGELRCSSGQVSLEGLELAHLTDAQVASRRAVLSQQLDLDFPFTVAEVVVMGCAQHPRSSHAAIVREALQRHDLADASNRLYPSLSGGEQRRVHLARIDAQASPALEAGRPYVLMLDEPATHLDPAHQLELAAWIRGMAARGASVLTVLHDFQLAASLADRIILLGGRGAVREGPASELLQPACLSPLFGIPVHTARGSDGEPVLYTGGLRAGGLRAGGP